MAMLAEPRRKQKWTINPRGKHWSEDSNKFGQRMLEKMGWTSGKGLGRNLDGMTEHIRARYKNDQGGIGYSSNDADKHWTEHGEGFDSLLQQLRNGETAGASRADDTELSGKSLELKSKRSRARVHYQKFTRGKDVNRYSMKDLANIFGKKDLNEKLENTAVAKAIEPTSEEPSSEPIGSGETSHGIVTIKGGSISDYFKSKIFLGGKAEKDSQEEYRSKNESDGETESHFGFGFASSQTSENEMRKLDNGAFDNSGFRIDANEETVAAHRKRKSDYVFENSAFVPGDGGATDSECKPKRRKTDLTENIFEQLESTMISDKKKSKKKKKEISEEITESEYQEPRINEVPVTSRKEKKKKNDVTNEALNLETVNDEEKSIADQFEISRSCRFGLINDAFDLADESRESNRRRVTFNDTVEYEISDEIGHKRNKREKKNKKKKSIKLDKFEVENKKLKKTMKEDKTMEIVAGVAYHNEAMDIENLPQEVNDNAANERKRKRNKKKSSSEDEDSKIETLGPIVENSLEERSEVCDTNAICPVEPQDDPQNPWSCQNRALKKVSKVLFAKDPVLQFTGSNINEIKGYGADLN